MVMDAEGHIALDEHPDLDLSICELCFALRVKLVEAVGSKGYVLFFYYEVDGVF